MSLDIYPSGEIFLDSDNQKLLKEIKYLIKKNIQNYPVNKITINSLGITKKGLKPNYLEYCNEDLIKALNKLSEYLEKKINLNKPKISLYADLHSFFFVNWHKDSSFYDYLNPKHKFFFKEKSKCIKFYIKMNYSFLDLICKDNYGNLKRLESNNKKLAYFEVRNTHKTYININSPNFLKKFVHKILDFFHLILVKLYQKTKGFDSVRFANFYFLIHEDNEFWAKYTSIEKERANNQIYGKNAYLDDHYSAKNKK